MGRKYPDSSFLPAVIFCAPGPRSLPRRTDGVQTSPGPCLALALALHLFGTEGSPQCSLLKSCLGLGVGVTRKVNNLVAVPSPAIH